MVLNLFDNKSRGYLAFGSLLYVISAISEIGLVAMTVPVINLVLYGDFNLGPLSPFIGDWFDEESVNFFLLCFCVLVIFVTCIRILVVYISAKIAFGIGHRISVDVYNRFVSKGYQHTLSQHSSQMISALSTKVNAAIQNFIYPLVSFLGGVIMLLLAMSVLLALGDTKTVFVLVCAVVSCYGTLIFVFKSKLKRFGSEVSLLQTNQVQLLQETVGLYREINTSNLRLKFLSKYRSIDHTIRRNQAFSILLGQSPRYLIEGLGILLIVLTLIAYGGATLDKNEVSILGAVIVGFVRFLPVINQIYRSWVNLTANLPAVRDVASLDAKMQSNSASSQEITGSEFQTVEDIALRATRCSYRYPEAASDTLHRFSLEVVRGEVVLISGASGSGKSTLLNLIMGFLPASEGKISLSFRGQKVSKDDHPAWLFGFAPQKPYLIGGSILENIVMYDNESKIDCSRLDAALDISGVSKMLDSTKLTLDSVLKEDGKSLSGGQRQRIALARVLYADKPFYVFDEATNSLDENSEREVWRKILDFLSDRTIFIITHRPESLPHYNKVLAVDDGHVVEGAPTC